MPQQEKKVCKLVKSLYGLKQPPKQWHGKFDQVMLSNSFITNGDAKCVNMKQVNGICLILCLDVDYVLLFCNNLHVIQDTKSFFFKHFNMKDFSPIDVILGIKLIRNESGITLTQSYYIEKLLKKFHYDDVKPMSTPFDPFVKLRKNMGESVSQLMYSQIIGSLLHLTNYTRPDIAYAIGKLSRYTQYPSIDH